MAITTKKVINLLVINFSRVAFQQQYNHVPSTKSGSAGKQPNPFDALSFGDDNARPC